MNGNDRRRRLSTRVSVTAAGNLPDYLVEVVAKEAWLRDRVELTEWDDLDEATRRGYRETARVVLLSRAGQTDIKR